jgi:hypothetical protein
MKESKLNLYLTTKKIIIINIIWKQHKQHVMTQEQKIKSIFLAGTTSEKTI